jgi:membrane protein YqaA with SNARE-associated domain
MLVNKVKWWIYFSFVGSFALAELIVLLFFPQYQTLVWYCFYTAISNFCIPWLPHEPIVLLYGTLFDPLLIALLGGIATCWVELLNYHVLRLITNIKRVQAITGKQWYQKAEGWFKKIPFLSLVISGFTPIPYAPFRVFAVTSKYPMTKYELAVFVGRTPRYYILALTGKVINLPWWGYGIIFLVMLTIALYSRLHQIHKDHKEIKSNKKTLCP